MRICDDLRQAVLQAAIQGKLTKQLPEDGSSEDLLKKIATEKAKLIKEGKIKKEKALPEISPDEIPFDIPVNWKWVRLDELCSVVTGRLDANAQNKSGKYAFFTCGVEVYRTTDYAFDCDAILLGGNNASGDYKIHRFCGKFNAYQRVYVITNPPKITLDYLFNVIKWWLPSLKHSSQGTTTQFIRLGQVKGMFVPLPPLAEQHRIVALVEELMARIDDLEKTETELEKLKAAFPGDMKAALLQAAMQGKLTEQLPEDGDAADLINQIAKEKSRLIKEGKIKKEKPLPEIMSDEMPFDIPENWVWVRLGSITYNRGQKNPDKDFTYIDIGSIDNKTNRLGDLTNILSPNQAPSRARKIVQNGDIIYSTVRPYLHNTCIIDRDIYPEPIVSTGFAVLSVTKGIYNRYLFRCLLSPMFDEYANSNENAKGVAYPAINDAKLMAAYIPLPPLAEQKRIVEKLDKLLPLCDGLVEE